MMYTLVLSVNFCAIKLYHRQIFLQAFLLTLLGEDGDIVFSVHTTKR